MTLILLSHLVPLLLLIGLGYVAGRWLEVESRSLAMVAIYFLSPLVNFGGVAQLNFQSAYLLLPPVLFTIAAGMALLTYRFARHVYTDNTRNLVAMAASTGNTGYFGTPLAGNTVTFAAQLKLRPGEAATVVLESTVFAVVYIPVVFWFTGAAQ